jgi:sugar lactone lactonase YvrE
LVIPSGLAIAPDGTPYFADARNHHIYRLVGDQVEVVAGALPISGGHAGDGGPAAKAKLSRPSAMAFAPDGSLYVADTGNLVIRKIAKDGTITTIAGLGLQASLGKFFGFSAGADEGAKASESLFVVPLSLAFDREGNLYVGEAGTSNIDLMGDKLPLPAALIPKISARIRKITPDGTVTTVVGPGGKALTDGELLVPLGLLVDTQGRLVISDGASNQVWMLPKGAF